MSLLPALLLLVLAEGLRRGRRFAWWSALGFTAVYAAVTGWYVAQTARFPDNGDLEVGFSYGVPILAPLAIALVLLLSRKYFTVRLPRHATRKFWRFTLGSIGLLSALYVFGGYLVRDQFTPQPGFSSCSPTCPHGSCRRATSDWYRCISAEWVADKGLPEMGFTLGGLEELAGDGVRCLLAIDTDRTVHGITSWLPVYADGEVVGYTLDFMRRRANGFRGTMEFLIASAALELKNEGTRFLSLSGAPLARLDRGERPRVLQRVLDLTGQVMEPVYGFRSLFAFKAKFQPVYRPMYMAYPDSAALPRIANAVSRAYLPNVTPRQGFRLAARVIGRS